MSESELTYQTAYWSVVAQVIPVIALALVLEARHVARRWRRKKNFRQQRQRRGWAITALVLTSALSLFEYWALIKLAEPERLNAFHVLMSSLANLTIALGVILVVSMPLSAVAGLGAIDTSPRMAARNQRRAQKVATPLRRDMLVLRSRIQGTRLRALGNRLRVITAIVQFDDVRGDLAKTAALVERFEGTRDDFIAVGAEIDQMLAEIDEQLLQLDENSTRLDKVVADRGDLRALEKFIRNQLADHVN